MGGAAIKEMAIDDGRTHSAGLILLFSKEDRPSASNIRDAISRIPNTTISYDPGEAHGGKGPTWIDGTAAPEAQGLSSEDENSWLEVLVNGLTFDLFGLTPGPAIAPPEAQFRVDYASDVDTADMGAIGIAPGPHLVGGMRSLVVARVLVTLGCKIAEQLGTAKAFIWLPSRCITGAAFFCSTVAAWDGGGPFPALGLTAFSATSDGALVSNGLSFFTDQELRLPPEMVEDPAAATRLAMRIVHQLVMHGPLKSSELITGPDGNALQLCPSDDGHIVEVRTA